MVWCTGFGGALANIGADFVYSVFPNHERQRTGVQEFVRRLSDQMKRRTDCGFEAVAEKVMGKAVWSQMKQNAQAANQHSAARNLTGGMRELADLLKSRQAVAIPHCVCICWPYRWGDPVGSFCPRPGTI